MSCPASDPRLSRWGRSRHRWWCRRSPFPRSECAGRTRRWCARVRVEIRRKNTARKPNRNLFRYMSSVFPAEAARLQAEIQSPDHRALDAAAVLVVVNALRSASTRPSAGPAGIDDASARHLFGNYAMVGKLSISRRGLTKGSRRRMLRSSLVPPGTSSVRRHGLRSAHSAGAHRARLRAQPQKIAE